MFEGFDDEELDETVPLGCVVAVGDGAWVFGADLLALPALALPGELPGVAGAGEVAENVEESEAREWFWYPTTARAVAIAAVAASALSPRAPMLSGPIFQDLRARSDSPVDLFDSAFLDGRLALPMEYVTPPDCPSHTGCMLLCLYRNAGAGGLEPPRYRCICRCPVSRCPERAITYVLALS